MKRHTINICSESERRLALRLVELAGINPANVSANDFTIYRNHVECDVFTDPPVITRDGTYARTHIIFPNKLGALALRKVAS